MVVLMLIKNYMQITNPKISVIVPVYNAEHFLPRCIDSILAQTFTDFELLLIDDGCKDNSGKICDEYAEKDKRVKVFHKDNGGVSSARNLGLDKANGEWICFCDSDDWIKRDFLSTFYVLMSNGDLLSQGFHSFNWHHKGDKDIFEKNGLYSNDNFLPFIFKLLNTNQLGFLWCKAFKKDIIDKYKIRFDKDIYLMEDLVFILQYCTHINSINNSEKCLYQYKFTEIGKKFHDQDYFYVYKTIYLLLREIDTNGLFSKEIKSIFIDDLLYNLINGNVKKNILKNHITFFIKEFKSDIYLCKCKYKKTKLYKTLYILNNEFYNILLIKAFRLIRKKNIF